MEMSADKKIIKSLSRIVHPDKGKDIVALGMVSKIEQGMEYLSP